LNEGFNKYRQYYVFLDHAIYFMTIRMVEQGGYIITKQYPRPGINIDLFIATNYDFR